MGWLSGKDQWSQSQRDGEPPRSESGGSGGICGLLVLAGAGVAIAVAAVAAAAAGVGVA